MRAAEEENIKYLRHRNKLSASCGVDYGACGSISIKTKKFLPRVLINPQIRFICTSSIDIFRTTLVKTPRLHSRDVLLYQPQVVDSALSFY